MLKKSKFSGIFFGVLLSIFLSGGFCSAADVSHDYGPIEWSFQGKPVPETRWAPWLPLIQTGFRFKLGFLISDGTITIKTPIKITVSYDPDAARSGQDFTFGLKAEPTGADYYTFQSAFGISFPNKLQLGFVGISGCPIDLPWFDLPLDFWQLVAKIPKVGDTIASAVSNIGVNTSTKGALPLGKTESYNNPRDLISVEISKYKVEDLAPDVLGKIPEGVRSKALLAIKAATFCSDSEALAKLKEYTENALSVLYDAPTLTLKGDPYFKLEGIRLRVTARVYIPGGKGSGLYTLYFDKMNQRQTVTFRDITPFITPGDKLVIDVQEVAYEFRLVQGLTASIQVSIIPINLDTVEKTVTYTTAAKDTSADPFKIEIPLLPSDALVQGLRANPGCTSASVNWASPSVPLKGTVKTYDGGTLVSTTIENTFKTAHNVIVPNLQAGKTYRFTVECVNPSGQIIPGGEVSTTTPAGPCPERNELTTSGALTLSNPTATAGPDYVDFSWTTNNLASTEVKFSPSPDLSLNYVMAVKKVGDVVTQGWVTREGPRQFETNHTLRLSGLDPTTKYYYNLRSWTFTDNDETHNPQDKVGYVSDITTLQGLPDPTVKIRVRSPSQGNSSIPNTTVILTKNTDMDFRLPISSGDTGVSQDIVLDRGTTYTVAAQPNACYQNGTAEVVVSPTAQGPLSEAVINVEKIPVRMASVMGSPNQGIGGATVSGKNSQGMPVSTTTNGNGFWAIESGLNPGSHTFTITKDGFKTTTVTITVNSCGRFIGSTATLVPRTYTLNITVKNQAGQKVKNASVVIKEGDTPIATLTTDTQGKATKAGTLSDDNEHIFTVAVTPPPTSTENIVATQDFVSVTSASTNTMTITCPADKKAPVPSQISIAQVGSNALQASFKMDDPLGKSSVEYQDPQGLIKSTQWKAGIYSQGSGMSDNTITVQGSAIKPGNYRIKIKTKDKWNNEGGSEIKEFQLFGESLWDFKASQSQSTITFTWKKYPAPDKFGKYSITIPTKPVMEITDINTTSYTLTSYSSTSARQAKIIAVAADGTNLTLPATASLQATSASQQTQQGGNTTGGTQPPQAEQSTGGAELPQTQTAQGTQLSTEQSASGASGQVQPTQQEQTSGGGQIAQEKTVLKFTVKPPLKTSVNKGISLKLAVKTLKPKKVPAICSVDWGDGKKDTADTEIPLKHAYAEAGKFQISATATPKDSGAFSLPEPVSAEITVSVIPPKVTLTKSAAPGGAPGYKFTIKAEEGSSPIGKWTLSFGDGATESGEGKVSKVLNHVYASGGNYKAEFSVADATGIATTKSLSFKFTPKKSS